MSVIETLVVIMDNALKVPRVLFPSVSNISVQ